MLADRGRSLPQPEHEPRLAATDGGAELGAPPTPILPAVELKGRTGAPRRRQHAEAGPRRCARLRDGLLALLASRTQPLTGYEPETGAVTEGLVLEGHFWDKEDSTLPLKADIPGKGGHFYSRTGILQPLLEAPFFAVGHLVDNTFGYFSTFPNAYTFLWFFNPFIAALAAVALFALVFQARRSLRWATTIAALFVLASIAWPYSKIGMETTFMFAAMTAFALAFWARRSPSLLSWGLTGFATGAAVATKAYALVVVLPIAILLWPALMRLENREKLRQALAVCLPVVLWIGVIAWYNWSRFGDVTEFGYAESPLTLSAPLNFLGLIFSPGKGLLLYSPLILIGALGLPRMWKADANLVLALLAFFVALTCMAGVSTYWGDEVWGPRYIVPAAWTLLVPIAWWASTVTRQKVLAGVACLAIVVQVIGVSTPYSHVHPRRARPDRRADLPGPDGCRPPEDPLRQRPDPLDPGALGAPGPERGPALLAGDRAADGARPQGHLRALRGP